MSENELTADDLTEPGDVDALREWISELNLEQLRIVREVVNEVIYDKERLP